VPDPTTTGQRRALTGAALLMPPAGPTVGAVG